jgi:hypothetical protein
LFKKTPSFVSPPQIVQPEGDDGQENEFIDANDRLLFNRAFVLNDALVNDF